MSLESRVDALETEQKKLDAGFHGLARVCADIKNITLTNQHDIAGLKVDIANVKEDVARVQEDVVGVKVCIAALTEATYAGFKRTDEKVDYLEQKFDKRIDQLEERFDNRTDQLEQKFGHLEQKFDNVEQKFDHLEQKFDQLELLIRQRLPAN